MDIQASQKGVLYHVTISSNLDSIWADGIDPHYSKGKFEATWYVSQERLLWAVLHVADRHDCKLDDIFVIAVNIDWRYMRRTNRLGVYYTKHTFTGDTVTPARYFTEGEF